MVRVPVCRDAVDRACDRLCHGVRRRWGGRRVGPPRRAQHADDGHADEKSQEPGADRRRRTLDGISVSVSVSVSFTFTSSLVRSAQGARCPVALSWGLVVKTPGRRGHDVGVSRSRGPGSRPAARLSRSLEAAGPRAGGRPSAAVTCPAAVARSRGLGLCGRTRRPSGHDAGRHSRSAWPGHSRAPMPAPTGINVARGSCAGSCRTVASTSRKNSDAAVATSVSSSPASPAAPPAGPRGGCGPVPGCSRPSATAARPSS